MALIEVFKPSIHDIHYSQVLNGLIKINGELYSPPANTKLQEGQRVKVTALPSSLLYNGKKVVLVKGERWTKI